jgi:hypothetical protein
MSIVDLLEVAHNHEHAAYETDPVGRQGNDHQLFIFAF